MSLNIIFNLKKDIFKIYKSELFRLCTVISRSITTLSQTINNIETVELAYSTYENDEIATKPPLILFHGLVATRDNWDIIGKAINQATGIKVIAIDARNHGASPHSPQHTYFHMAQDVVQLLKKLGLPKVSVLGHSMGGYTAMTLALIRPDLVSSLVIEDTSPVKMSPQGRKVEKLLDAMASLRIRSNIPMSKARELAHEHLKIITDDVNLRNHIIQILVNTDSGFYTWKTNLPIFKEILWTTITKLPDNLKGLQYTGPTLFIGGSLSEYLSKSDMPEIKKYFPSAELTFVDGAGHLVHGKKPEEFLEILCKFLIEN